MAAKDPERRRLAAQVAVHTQWSRLSPEQRTARTAAMRAAYVEKLKDEIDPQRRLAPDDLNTRVDNLRRARMAAMSLKAAAARQAKREAAVDAELDKLIADDGGAA